MHKLGELQKTQLLESLRMLRAKFGVVSGGLTVTPEGKPAFIFVDEPIALPESWQGTPVIVRHSNPDEEDEDREVIFTMPQVIETITTLYSKGEPEDVHPDDALRAGVLLAHYASQGDTELTRGAYKRIFNKLDDKPSED